MRACTAWWQDPAGRCTDDDAGAGRHRCGMKADHAMCRCACGATHKRPVDHVARFEARQRTVSLSVGPDGRGQVMVGGVDIANVVNGAVVELEGMTPPRVRLDIEAVRVAAEGDGVLGEDTHTAMLALGWVSPEGESNHREALVQALGQYGPADPGADWEALLLCVRGITARLEGLDK